MKTKLSIILIFLFGLSADAQTNTNFNGHAGFKWTIPPSYPPSFLVTVYWGTNSITNGGKPLGSCVSTTNASAIQTNLPTPPTVIFATAVTFASGRGTSGYADEIQFVCAGGPPTTNPASTNLLLPVGGLGVNTNVP